MKVDINNSFIHKILKLLDISSLDELSDDKRYDCSLAENLKSSSELMNRVATEQVAVFLFYLFLGRYEGEERAGRNTIDIVNEFLCCEEYNRRKLSYQIRNCGSSVLKCQSGDLKINIGDDITHAQGIYSCLIEYRDGFINITLPKNFHEPTFENRFIPFLPILCESLIFLRTIKSKTEAIDFFYGDHPSRDIGLAFSSNKTNDFLLPDPDVLAIFKNPPVFKYISWGDRKSVAYFRGSDTGSSYCKSIDRSQRMILCKLANKHFDFIDAKLTNCEDKKNIDFYKEKGVWGEREPLENIELYKYNIDVDGNSNSWAGLVNKLCGGLGGVILKVDSQEGYRQWFYNRLQPWVNFVPIAADLSDIIDKIKFLQENDSFAQGIQKNAANIFSGVDYEYLKNYAAHVIVSALLRLR